MSLLAGRVIKAVGNAATLDAPWAAPHTEPPTRPHRVSRFELDARERARAIREEAEALARERLAEAELAARRATESAVADARAHEEAKFAAHYVALQLEADARLAAEAERLGQMAALIAERLVGEALSADPARIHALAEAAIAQARGAGAVTLDAHPEDARSLRERVRELRSHAVVNVRESAELERGSLLVHTELGTLDARLRPQLERLAAHLTALLRGG